MCLNDDEYVLNVYIGRRLEIITTKKSRNASHRRTIHNRHFRDLTRLLCRQWLPLPVTGVRIACRRMIRLHICTGKEKHTRRRRQCLKGMRFSFPSRIQVSNLHTWWEIQIDRIDRWMDIEMKNEKRGRERKRKGYLINHDREFESKRQAE